MIYIGSVQTNFRSGLKYFYMLKKANLFAVLYQIWFFERNHEIYFRTTANSILSTIGNPAGHLILHQLVPQLINMAMGKNANINFILSSPWINNNSLEQTYMHYNYHFIITLWFVQIWLIIHFGFFTTNVVLYFFPTKTLQNCNFDNFVTDII